MQRQTKHNQRKDSFGSAVANRLDLPDYVLPGILQMLMLANILNPLTHGDAGCCRWQHCVWRAQLLSPPHSCICCCLRRCAQHRATPTLRLPLLWRCCTWQQCVHHCHHHTPAATAASDGPSSTAASAAAAAAMAAWLLLSLQQHYME